MRILLIDDQRLMREGLRSLLANMSDTDIAEASGKSDALALLKAFGPDVVILPSSIEVVSPMELIRRVRRERRAAKILILGKPGEVMFAARALAAGAMGYASKDLSAPEFINAVRKVAAGQKYLDQATAVRMFARGTTAERDVLDRLTTRQVEILRELGQGHGLKTIAEKIGVSYKTIANTCASIKTKFGLKRTSDLVRIAIELQDI